MNFHKDPRIITLILFAILIVSVISLNQFAEPPTENIESPFRKVVDKDAELQWHIEGLLDQKPVPEEERMHPLVKDCVKYELTITDTEMILTFIEEEE